MIQALERPTEPTENAAGHGIREDVCARAGLFRVDRVEITAGAKPGTARMNTTCRDRAAVGTVQDKSQDGLRMTAIMRQKEKLLKPEVIGTTRTRGTIAESINEKKGLRRIHQGCHVYVSNSHSHCSRRKVNLVLTA